MTASTVLVTLDGAEIDLTSGALREVWEYTNDRDTGRQLLNLAQKLGEAKNGVTDPAAYGERIADLSSQVLGLAPAARELLLGYLAGIAPDAIERALAALPPLHKAVGR